MNPNPTKALAISNRENQSIFVLIVLYIVGVFGILIPFHSDFLLLTPLNLLISLALVLWNHPKWNTGIVIALILSWIVGFSIEHLGVSTGQIFGEYAYGPVLGYKLWNTPLMIGINWMLLIYCTSIGVNYFLPKSGWFLKSILAATLMVSLDVLIEPVAIHYDFWQWTEPEVPLQNYIGWWLLSFCLNSLFVISDDYNSRNKVALYLLIIQFLFFWVIGLFLPG